MKVEIIRVAIVRLVFTASLLMAVSSNAAQLTSGSVGNWVSESAQPHLIQLVSNQPRFLGETLDIVQLKGDQPEPVSNELTRRLAVDLRQTLLMKTEVRLQAGAQQQCSQNHAIKNTRPKNYLNKNDVLKNHTNIVLGIEVTPLDDSHHQVTLAMLDVDEGYWINGSTLVWVGKLTTAQRKLLSTPLNHEAPLYADQYERIASALAVQLNCAGPMAEPIFLRPGDSPVIPALRLQLSSNVTFTDAPDKAKSVLIVEQPDPGYLTVTLLADDRRVQLAKVSVVNYPSRAPILSEIKTPSRLDSCRGEGKDCTEIRYELYEDAYLVEFVTRDASVIALSCEFPTRTMHGRLSHGLRIPESIVNDRPSLGYYVLATPNASLARALHSALVQGSTNCGGAQSDGFERLVEIARSGQASWQAAHFRRQNTIIERIGY